MSEIEARQLNKMVFTVGIIGGGIAGSTIALKLSKLNIKCVLFEKGPSLVNGPPMCHLHAGGALYRQIPLEECIKLLKQSIDTMKCFKYCANVRPTLLTVPVRDPGEPSDVINRLEVLTSEYRKLILQDKSNEVLGKPEDYFKVFSKQEVEGLREAQMPQNPQTVEEWMIPPAKYLDLTKFKFPFVMVQEYGLSSTRVSAFANLTLKSEENCKTLLNCNVSKIHRQFSKKWKIWYTCEASKTQQCEEVDYLVNACGYESGVIDQMCGFKRQRILQFKAAYISKWQQNQGKWPEVIIHGRRGTPEGMAQLTPYVNNFFQIHGMTQEITLFEKGKVKTDDTHNIPSFGEQIDNIISRGWNSDLVQSRTRKAIDFVSHFIPSFRSAQETQTPLWGVQQIPGSNPELRASEISYQQNYNYARSEIVKASTAIQVANNLLLKLKQQFNIECLESEKQEQVHFSAEDVNEKGRQIAKKRKQPQELADFYQ